MTPLKHEETPHFHSDIYVSPRLGKPHYPALAAALQSFIDQRCRDALQGYIWQREPLHVSVCSASADGTKRDRLTAYMRHGGSVEDEWLAVHLLMLASAASDFTEEALLSKLQPLDGNVALTTNEPAGPGLVVSVSDEDGDFPLIEAADVLPSWVQPSNAEGRFWIAEGRFHLISPDVHPGDANAQGDGAALEDAKPLKHSTALMILCAGKHDTLAPPSTSETIVRQRLPTYPDLTWALDVQHSTLVYLPMVAAKIVTRYPQMVADAAEAFSGRDGPGDARRLRDMTFFGTAMPQQLNRSSDMPSFLVRIKLPRRLYATLLAEKYFPPKTFGAQWRDGVMRFWDLLEKQARGSAVQLTDEEQQSKDDGRRRDLGCKIACGLELAYANVKERQRAKPRSLFEAQNDSIRSSPAYTRFIESLDALGFFGDELRDSYEWKQRERQAIELWRKTVVNADEEDGEEYSSERLAFLLDAVPSCARDRSFPPHVNAEPKALALLEDPDSFLYDAPTDVPLSTSAKATEAETDAEEAAMQQINAFADKLDTFVEGQGDEQGALFEDEGMDGEGDVESDDEGDGEGEARRRFALLSAEDKQRAMADLVTRPPDEEWGAKTAEQARMGRAEAERLSKASQSANLSNGGQLYDEEISREGVQKATVPPPAQNPGAAHGFSRHVKYDGASDSDESIDDEVLRAGDTDEDRLNRARQLGIESDLHEEETRRRMAQEDGDHDDETAGWEDSTGDELGHDDLMGFIDFTRKELGLTEEQYEDILEQRRQRGAYVPAFDKPSHKGQDGATGFSQARALSTGKSVSFTGTGMAEPEGQSDKSRTFRQQTRENADKSLRNQRTTESEKDMARRRAEQALHDAEKKAAQQKLGRKTIAADSEHESDPFQRLMNAMDAELMIHKQGKGVGSKPALSEEQSYSSLQALMDENGEDGEDEEEDEEMDDLSAQDAELLEKMLHSGPPATLRALLQKEGENPLGLSAIERQVMDGMLQSYEAQMGGAGPVGSLVGRFGLGRLPRSTSSDHQA